MIAAAAQKATGGPFQLYVWSCLHGLIRGKDRVGDAKDLDACLGAFLRVKDPSVLICKDLHLILDGSPQLMRRLKDCACDSAQRKEQNLLCLPVPEFASGTFFDFQG